MNKIREFGIEFLKSFILMIVIFLIGLWVSNNNLYEGLLDYSWLIIIVALGISLVRIYLKPKLQQK